MERLFRRSVRGQVCKPLRREEPVCSQEPLCGKESRRGPPAVSNIFHPDLRPGEDKLKSFQSRERRRAASAGPLRKRATPATPR